VLAALAFFTYAGAVFWHNQAYKSTWRLEQTGPLLVATSYLFYGQPFGLIDGDLWHYVLKRVAHRALSQEEPADSLLKLAANHDRSPKLDSIGRITPTGTVTKFPLSTRLSFPKNITAGPDGALWFTEAENGGKIGRITTVGAISELAVPTVDSRPFGIAAGPAGALWFTEYAGNKIGRICLPNRHDVDSHCGLDISTRSTAEHVATPNITEFPIPTSQSGVTFIAAGPEGVAWFSQEGSRKIGRITSAGVISEFPLPPDTAARGITAGPDGNLWFTDFVGNKIGRMTATGTVTAFPIPTPDSMPSGITVGPDGALWFTEFMGNKIGRVTTDGVIAEFPLPANCAPNGTCSPLGITRGPDGALWFTESDGFGNQIGRITTDGVIAEFPVPFGTSPQYIAAGPDGALWFTDRDIPAQAMLQSDGNGLGYSFLATASLFFFGPHTLSLVLGFVVLLGIPVLLFLLRFSDDRLLAVSVLFLALTLMLLTPHATNQTSVDQAPIGGIRFMVIAGILPALHVIFELFDSTSDGMKPSSYALLALQFVLLLCVTTIRMSTMYFLAGIVLAAMIAIWIHRRDAWDRRLIIAKVTVLLSVAIAAFVAGKLLTPTGYREAGATSEVFWHRAFGALGVHPDFPYGDLATRIDCRPEIPEGLVLSALDRNGHCAYFAALKKGAEPGPIYGAQYERLLRRTFLQVVKEYPRQVLETYLIYKPLLIWKALAASTQLDISRRTMPILITLALQVTFLMTLLFLPSGGTSHRHTIFAAFIVIIPFSLAPPLLAYSSMATSTDLICYMYIVIILVVIAALRYLPVGRVVQSPSTRILSSENHLEQGGMSIASGDKRRKLQPDRDSQAGDSRQSSGIVNAKDF
jgi:virginiamycin B lyase